MKIKTKGHADTILSVLSALGFNVKNLPANAHSLYVYETKTVNHMSEKDAGGRVISTDEYFEDHKNPEYELKTTVTGNKVTHEFVKVEKKKWKFKFNGETLSIVDAETNDHVVFVLNLKEMESLVGVKPYMDAKGYDTTGLEFDDEGRIIFK